MKIGYRSPGLRDLDFRGKFELCRELGLKSIEVHVREFDSEPPEQVRELAAEMGIAITAMSAATNLAVPSLYDETIGICEENIAACLALGVDFIFTRSMWPEEGVPQMETWNHLVPATRQMAQMCADAGVKLGFETDHGCFIDTLERCERLMDAVDHENFYYNFDPANFYIGGSDPMEILKRYPDRIVNGHIKDGVYQHGRREETAIGEGEVPYREIFAKIDELGLDIAMNIEHVSTAQAVTDGAKFALGVLDQLGITQS